MKSRKDSGLSKLRQKSPDAPEVTAIEKTPASSSGVAAPTSSLPASAVRPVTDNPGRAMSAVLRASFDAVASPTIRRRLKSAKAIAVVISVPSPAWVNPIARYFKRTYGGERWWQVVRDGSSRSAKAGVGSDEIASHLALGLSVVAIAADPSLLPAVLTSAMDISIRVDAPGGAVIRRAIAAFTGRAPAELEEHAVRGLDLLEILACFRPGFGAQRIADRLLAAAAVSGRAVDEADAPDLAGAVEYGRAREWGLALARSVQDFREGRVEWSALPRGILLHGEPGTGKSLFSRALAKTCQLPLVVSSCADWFTRGSGHLGDVIVAMRESHASALAQQPAIWALDECDSIPNRARLDQRNADFWLPVVTDLLRIIDDGTSSARRQQLIIVGCTNDVTRIDAALLRPGRLELTVEIERPDLAGTTNILRHHLHGDLPASDIAELAVIAERSNGAEIMAFVRDARELARQAGRPLTTADMMLSLLPPDPRPPDAIWRICVHEAGHAVGALAAGWGDLRRCTIRQMGDSAGHTLIEPTLPDLPTRRTVESRVITLLCGRAAEQVLLAARSVGDQSDLAHATQMIASVHGTAALGETIAHLGASDTLPHLIRQDLSFRHTVEADLQRLQKMADGIIRQHRQAVIAVATLLRDRRTASGDQIRQIFRERSMPPESKHQRGVL